MGLKRKYIYVSLAVIHRPQTVPYALRGKVTSALEKLVDDGIIESVQHYSWAAPMVSIVKHDGLIWLRGDYKVLYTK